MAVVFCLNRPSDEFFINFFKHWSVFLQNLGKSNDHPLLYHLAPWLGGLRAQWIVSSVSLSSFWQGAFASIGIYRPTGQLGYCVFSLLADHIDRWLLGGLRAQWIVYSVSLSSFWPGAFASIDICRLLTGLFGYCVYSLLADHIDRWLPKSFTEKWDYETYLACNCGTYLKRRYEILWRPFLTLSSLEVKAGLAF